MKPYRVLLVCDSYPPVLGGSEVEAQRFASAMIRRGHEVHVLCSGGPPMPSVRNWVDPCGVPVTILTRRSEGVRKHWVFAAEVARAIFSRRKTYDVVYFLMQGLHLLTGLAMSRLLHKRTVMKISGSSLIPMMRASRAGRIELDWLQKWRVPVMLLNQGMIEEAVADGFTREDLIWMPNFVEIDEFSPVKPGEAAAWRSSHDIPADALVVVYVGRLSHEKGLPCLLRGFAHAARNVPEALLLIIGEGDLRRELEALAATLNLNRQQIRFTGRVNTRDVPCWLKASDVFALTSPNEGFPCALLEAMAVSLPSVVTDIPANLQLIDEGLHGLTAPFNDDEAIGQAFARLLSNADLRRRMGEAARERVVDNYSTDRVIERYETVFRDAMKETKD